MSGLVALISTGGRRIDRELAEAMIGRVAHRGDTPPRTWATDRAVLGHVHRPTTPEALHEVLPASDPSGRFWLTWDGRLDNREELASLLGLSRSNARSESDASYVLRALVEWGDDAVERLVGDWALVLYDRLEHRLMASRDPVSRRPLFAATIDGVTAIASEPQQFAANGFLPPEPNYDFMRRFISNAVSEPGSTHLEGVTEIEGGTRLTVTEHGIECDRYWTTPRTRDVDARSPDECVEAFVEAFDMATRARLRAVKPIGVLLSGGIDSSYVTAVAAPLAPLTALTSFAPETERMDERRYASIVVEHTGVLQREIEINDCWTLSSAHLPDHVFDQPFHPGQSANQRLLGQRAADLGIGVILDGVGGDEWFTGAPYYIADALLHGHPLRSWLLAVDSPRHISAASLYTRDLYRGLVPGAIRDKFRRIAGHDDPADHAFFPFADVEPSWRSITTTMSQFSAYSTDAFRRATWEIHRRVGVQEALWRERQAEQPFGIERRSPFDDLRVIELMASMPEWIKRYRGRRKDLLRTALDRHMPVIGDRLDHGIYNELFLQGVRVNERPRSDAAAAAVAAAPGVRKQALLNEYERFISAQHEWWQPSWRVISAGMWLQQMDTRRGADRAAGSRSLASQRSEFLEV